MDSPTVSDSFSSFSSPSVASCGTKAAPPQGARGPLALWPAGRNRAAPRRKEANASTAAGVSLGPDIGIKTKPGIETGARPRTRGSENAPSRSASVLAAPAPAAGPQFLPPSLRRDGDRLDAAAPAAGVLSTGFAPLDAQLPGSGWPRRALTELLLPHAGVGEMRLLAPALAATLAVGRLVMLFDPPAQLSAWVLTQLGLDAQQLLVIDGRSPVLPDASSLWALEQALRSGHVGAVVAWLPPRLRADRLRRLQLAAQQHDGPAFVLRETAARDRPTAAPLRLALQATGDDRLALRLLKRRGPPLEEVLTIGLPPVRLPEAALEAARRVGSSQLSEVLGGKAGEKVQAAAAQGRGASSMGNAATGFAPAPALGLAPAPASAPAPAPVARATQAPAGGDDPAVASLIAARGGPVGPVPSHAGAGESGGAAACGVSLAGSPADCCSTVPCGGGFPSLASCTALYAPLQAAVFVDLGG